MEEMNDISGLIQDESLSLPTYPIAYLCAKNVFMVLPVWTQKWEIKGGHSIKKYKRRLNRDVEERMKRGRE